jgi:hypothetical protein
MSGGQWMVVLIVAIVMIASIVKTRHQSGRRARCGETGGDSEAENARLRQELAELKERLKVLERIAVDKENTLARQIEELRDR